MQQAIKNKPKDFDPSDWQWLVQEHFYSKDFIAMSLRNSQNRAGLKMPHRTGSKPFREIIYNMGGKENRPPTLDELFFETRKKGDTLVDVESSRMHAELVDVVSSDPNLSNVEVMDKCYNGNKRRDHLIGFGGGVKARDNEWAEMRRDYYASCENRSDTSSQRHHERIHSERDDYDANEDGTC
ncbi:hypothetical protein OsI_15513 [Oryza sativa Indica Group]|uniref:Uncharacterized protein n=1 Tax=Oryza sativa subsp. indica TaxID=39946 RepID=B8ASR9_ORYSI|nr:hypothetical protein OsI_15513 [Oryza sativa Indica Group]